MLKSILSNSCRLSASSRCPKDVKMPRLVLYTERGRFWYYPWDWKLFILFVLYGELFSLKDAVVEAVLITVVVILITDRRCCDWVQLVCCWCRLCPSWLFDCGGNPIEQNWDTEITGAEFGVDRATYVSITALIKGNWSLLGCFVGFLTSAFWHHACPCLPTR